MAVWGRITVGDEVIYERRAPNQGIWWYWFNRLLENDLELRQCWEEACQRNREKMRRRVMLKKVSRSFVGGE